jgi:hypothetical protein
MHSSDRNDDVDLLLENGLIEEDDLRETGTNGLTEDLELLGLVNGVRQVSLVVSVDSDP